MDSPRTSRPKTPPIHVVMPAFQEEAMIADAIADVPECVERIWVVDDASQDRTQEAAMACGDGRVRVLAHAQNQGVFAAIRTGYRAALAEGARVAVVMAGDGQMSGAELEAVVAPILEGQADYVKGNRVRHRHSAHMPPLRRWGSQVFGRLTGWAIAHPGLGDAQCGYTAISDKALRTLPLERIYGGYGYPNDFLSWVKLKGLRLEEVVVSPVYGNENSGMRVWHALRISLLIARARWRRYRALPQVA